MFENLTTPIIFFNKKTSVNVNEIVLLEANINYTTIHFDKGRQMVLATTIKKMELLLKEHGFLRIHKKYVLNLSYTDDSLLKSGTFTLQNNIQIRVSRRKRGELRKKMKVSRTKINKERLTNQN
ncbi:LytR/AlgR family response regulator transcription factor [Emticicia sp. 17c]|uniref:LytR/AlgR family response regulator transcription factor n=1 Tax=Emticicia sp. 17c TaxID=3127704 RepID=UPI00301BA0C3